MSEKNILPRFTFGWKGAAALIGGALLPVFILSSLDVALLFFFKKNIQYTQWFLLLSNTLMWCGAIWAFDYLLCRPETGKKLNFNFSTKNLSTYLLIFPLMLGMMFISEFITSQIPTTGKFFGPMYEWFSLIMSQMSSDSLMMVIMAVIMAPIFEEIVFRGIIQKGLINKGIKPMTAIWISAVVFGLIHGNPWQFAGAVLLGFVLGLVYHKTKSLLMPILLHAFNNGISTLLISYGETESFADFFGVSEYWVLASGIVLFVMFYYLFTNKYEIHHSE
ncbi:MAG: type II CAAX endopeptidase family protein [Bergeyella sp.]